MSLSPIYYAAVFYFSLALFGLWAGVVNLLCFALAWLRPAPRTEQFFQRLIHGQVAAFVRWLVLVRAVRIEYRGWAEMPKGPAVMVGNHPGLLDAFFVLARVPRAICLFKPAIRHNPALASAARRAGYVASDTGIDLIRNATARIASGSTLIVFPEGTRTPAGVALGPLRPGFALIARRARVPVQLVRISSERPFFGKERRWWKLQQLPARIVVHAGPRFEPDPDVSTEMLVAQVETWYRGAPAISPSARPEIASPLTRPLAAS